MRSLRCYIIVVLALAACGKSAKEQTSGSVVAGGRTAHIDKGTETAPPPVVGEVDGRGATSARQPQTEPPTHPTPAPEPGAVKASSASFGNELASLYNTWAAEEQALLDDAKTRMQTAIEGQGGVFAKAIKGLYTARENRFVWSKGGQLTEDADKLLEILYAVETHGLDPTPFALDDLKAQVKAFSDASLAASTAQVSPAGEAPDQAALSLWSFLVANRQIAPAMLADVAASAGYSDADLGRLSDARKRLNALLAAQKAVNGALADVDVAVTRRMYRWVYDMRFARKAHPFIADKSDTEGVARSDKDIGKLIAAANLDEPGAIDKLAAQVTPRFPDYAPTIAALARYRELAAAYPQHLELPKEVEKLAIDMKGKGKAKEAIMLLAQRLKQEGFYAGEPTGEFGADLEAAVKAYQETHQLKVSGKLEKVMRTSLNRSYEERAKTIALSLQRYRESDLHQGAFRIGEVPVRARVNIPGFDARFYQGLELARTHRIVVGNNDTDFDATLEKRGKLNQTRLITAEMQTIILNPVWRVPRRIKEQELDTLLMDEPDYYEKHNFKVEVQPDGTELVVQQPGPGNALGLVKFLFPNQFSIYMHDTQSKKLFDRPVRAYSHGCMRTQNPLDLAQWILVDLTGQLDQEKFDEILKSGKETAFQLKQRIPISTDYVTTGIDEQGRIVFYADVYGFDRDYFEGKTPYATDNKLPLTVIF